MFVPLPDAMYIYCKDDHHCCYCFTLAAAAAAATTAKKRENNIGAVLVYWCIGCWRGVILTSADVCVVTAVGRCFCGESMGASGDAMEVMFQNFENSSPEGKKKKEKKRRKKKKEKKIGRKSGEKSEGKAVEKVKRKRKKRKRKKVKETCACAWICNIIVGYDVLVLFQVAELALVHQAAIYSIPWSQPYIRRFVVSSPLRLLSAACSSIRPRTRGWLYTGGGRKNNSMDIAHPTTSSARNAHKNSPPTAPPNSPSRATNRPATANSVLCSARRLADSGLVQSGEPA